MLVVLIIFFFLFFPVQLLGLGSDDCKPTSCKKDGPRIQFPFRNKNLHPEYCGYPGFDAYCDENNQTVLVLPFSVSFIVKKINYVTQNVHLSDQENCLLKKLPYLNLSASPFYFPRKALSNYNLFNCTASERRRDLYYLIPCLSDSNNKTYAIDSDGSMDYLPIISCTKIYDISSVPWDIVDRNNFDLNWAEPACGFCEAQGKRCSFFKNRTTGHQIQCIDIPNTKKQGTSKRLLITGATLGSFLVVITLAALVLYVRAYKHNSKKIEKFLEDYRALKPTRFSYSDIRRITLQFREKLGEGGYGIVYKGKLSNEINIAVKVLTNSKGNGEEFVNEVCTIGRIHHVNVVRLLGFCAEGFRRALVYEFMPNDSLEKFIFQSDSKRRSLGWQKLRDIALGIAKGIEYLHQGCDQQILHFDIKPHNILLDHNFNPKICDFGLAKLCSKDQSAVTMTAARGTMGYIAPEVLSRAFGRVSHKSDIYSFGMLLLEMVGGRKNIDPNANTSQVYFPQWIYNHLDLDIGAQNEEGDDGNVKRRLTIVGLWCIQWCPNDRPSMSLAVEMLEGHEEKLEVPPNPFPATNAAISIAGVPEEHYQTATSFILE